MVGIFRTTGKGPGEAHKPLESVFSDQFRGKVARMVEVTAEIIEFLPLKRWGATIWRQRGEQQWGSNGIAMGVYE